MTSINICYVLDCSGSMSCMPDKGVTVFLNSVDDLKNMRPELTKCVKIIEFGSGLKVSEFAKSEDVAKNFNWTRWKCSMGQTALYDAVVMAILSSKPKGVITVLTDGNENDSWSTKDHAVALAKEYRRHGGQIRMIGPGNKEHLESILDTQVDSVFPLDPKEIHLGLTSCLGSAEYRGDTQELIDLVNF